MALSSLCFKNLRSKSTSVCWWKHFKGCIPHNLQQSGMRFLPWYFCCGGLLEQQKASGGERSFGHDVAILPLKSNTRPSATHTCTSSLSSLCLSQQYANRGSETSTGAKRHTRWVRITYADMQSNADKRPTLTLMVQAKFPTHFAHCTFA